MQSHRRARSSRSSAGLASGFTRARVALACACALGVSGATTLRAQEGGKGGEVVKDRLSALRETVQQLTKVRDQISKERLEWRQRKQSMLERMELLRAQVADYRKKIEVSRGKSTETDKSTKELREKLARLDKGVDVLKDAIASLETKVRALAPRLPAPATALIRPLLEAIPKDAKAAKETKLSLAQRYSFVTGFLDTVGKFHRDIKVESELRSKNPSSSADTKVAVTTVYFGCGQAFYASDKAEVAGIGTASDAEWVWVPKNDKKDVEAIRLLIAIVRGEKGAAFVPVPVVIK